MYNYWGSLSTSLIIHSPHFVKHLSWVETLRFSFLQLVSRFNLISLFNIDFVFSLLCSNSARKCLIMPAEYSPQWSLFEVYARGLTNFPHSRFPAAFPILAREQVSLFLIGPLTWHKMNCIHYRLAHDVFMTANGYVSTVLSGAEVVCSYTVTRWSPTDPASPNTGSTPDVSRQNIFFFLSTEYNQTEQKAT